MKYYFDLEGDGLFCHPLYHFKKWMQKYEVKELTVNLAKPVFGEGKFFCQKNEICGESRDFGCGKLCINYVPRNGKNGRCRNSGLCYEPTDVEKKLKIKL